MKTLTKEQVGPVISQARRILINAAAGSGKTHTLEAYASRRPNENILYLVYNKAVQIEAAGRFPENVECRTAHSISYGAAARQFGAAKSAKIGDMRPFELAQRFSLSASMAHAAWASLIKWMGSADESIKAQHIPADLNIPESERDQLVKKTREIWAAMLNKDDVSVKMPHDGYLKLFQLSKPVIKGKKKPYDVILVDEFQDCNDVLLDILERQPAKVVYAGDENQAIYEFRGAVNAEQRITVDERFRLTQSFRFGQPIADLANQLLGYFKHAHKPIIGCGPYQASNTILDKEAAYAVVARTNAALFESAVENLDCGVPYHFVGAGTADKVATAYKFGLILDAYRLWNGQKAEVVDRFIRKFASFDDMSEVADKTKDNELLYLCKIVNIYQNRIPELVRMILAKHIEIEADKEHLFRGIYFTTAHRSKGLQFRQVMLTNDYLALVTEDGEPIPRDEINQQEVNLLYVAMTRAEQVLALNAGFIEFLIAIVGWEESNRRLEPLPPEVLRTAESATETAPAKPIATQAITACKSAEPQEVLEIEPIPEWLLAEPPADISGLVQVSDPEYDCSSLY